MAKQVICDRCTAVIPNSSGFGQMTSVKISGSQSKEFDLCQSCGALLRQFIESNPAKEFVDRYPAGTPKNPTTDNSTTGNSASFKAMNDEASGFNNSDANFYRDK